MFRHTVIAASIALATLASAHAQAPAAPASQAAPAGVAPVNPPLTIKPLRGGAYWVEGGIANTGFVVGDKGVIVIDAQMFVDAAATVQAEIAKITPKPVSQIILTHSDRDHVLALPAYPAGTPIIAHEHTRADMLAASADPAARPASRELKNFLPTRTVTKREDLVLEGVRVTLLNTASAHTDGDLAVYLPAQKIVFAGDLVTPGIGDYPGIHLCKRGSSLGWIQSLEAVLALDADTYISGHGEPLTRAELQTRVDAAKVRRSQIQALVGQGKSLVEVKAALHDVPLLGLAARFPTFVETTYQELTKTGPDCGPPPAPPSASARPAPG
ncbi:MAG: MBL fold metallo-hydrolase [Pseudomonadota bacterium]